MRWLPTFAGYPHTRKCVVSATEATVEIKKAPGGNGRR